ncbi:MAG: DUF1800 domain-containing protein [Solirubrobacterales bacterium]
MAAVPRYEGTFGVAQAERLLWRAAFGGGRADAERLAAKGLERAVRSLTRPRDEELVGAAPTDEGDPIAPFDHWGHDVLWALDRMVRSRAPALERMALLWHDWFATGDVSSQRLSIQQWKLFRRHALGNFNELTFAVTKNPAMLVWLSGIDNHKDWPNENYGRELMELFTLGAAVNGYPYTEDDVREQARALTGFAATWRDDVGFTDFRFQESRHDTSRKTIFGRQGNFDWRDSVRLCLEHQAHAPYFVERMWSHFVPVSPDAGTRAALEELYLESGYAVRPVVEAILMHPTFHAGPTLVKPPIVMIAGMLRARGRGVDENSWAWLSDLAGQRVFRPPNVAGWDETRWLDTSSFRGRWMAGGYVCRPAQAETDGAYPATETSAEAVERALRFWGEPSLSPATRTRLVQFADQALAGITNPGDWRQSAYRGLRQNALRMLIASSPDMQAS